MGSAPWRRPLDRPSPLSGSKRCTQMRAPIAFDAKSTPSRAQLPSASFEKPAVWHCAASVFCRHRDAIARVPRVGIARMVSRSEAMRGAGHGAPERSAFALSARNALVSRARLGWFEAAHEAALSRVFDRARRAQRPNRPPPPATPCQPACRWPYARMLASPKASSQQRALAARVPRCRPT